MSSDLKIRAVRALRDAGFTQAEALGVVNGPGRDAFREKDLRDQFAMAALQGALAHPKTHLQESNNEKYAVYAYTLADQMMKARDA